MFYKKYCSISFIFLVSFIFFTYSFPKYVYSQSTNDQAYINQIDPQQVTPSDGQSDVPINTSVIAFFNDMLDIFSLDYTLTAQSNNPYYIDGQIYWNQEMLSLIFTPIDYLPYDITHQASLDLLAYDSQGQFIQSQHQWSFNTQASPWLHYFEINGIDLQEKIQEILSLDNGDLWIVTTDSSVSESSKLFRFDGKTWHQITTNFGIINGIAKDSNGGVWLATDPDINNIGGGVYYYNGSNWKNYNNTNSNLPENGIRCITIDSKDQIWVGWTGYFTSGISVFDKLIWQNYNVENNLITCILEDNEDNIWIGTQFGEIISFDTEDNNWTYHLSEINSELGIDSFIANALASDNENIWIGTNVGLLKYNRILNEWNFFNQATGTLSNDFCTELLWEAENGLLWIGKSDGIQTYNGLNWLDIPITDASPGIRAIVKDTYGRIWFGTEDSLSIYDTDSPALTGFTPGNNQQNIPAKSTITLSFDEPMDTDSVLNALSITPSTNYTSSWNTYKTKLTLTPKTAMKYSTSYMVNLAASATDLSGHELINSYSWSFKTEKKPVTNISTGFSNTWSSGFNLGGLISQNLGSFTGYSPSSFTGYSTGVYTGYSPSSFTGYSTGIYTGYKPSSFTGYSTGVYTGYSPSSFTGYSTSNYGIIKPYNFSDYNPWGTTSNIFK